MPHRSISSLVLIGLVAVLTGGSLMTLNKPPVDIAASAASAQVGKLSQVGRADLSTAGPVSDSAQPVASPADCPCPGECGAAEHYRQLEH